MQTALSRPHVRLTSPVLRAMFRSRKRVFVDLLRWDVPVLEGMYEIDQFDTPDARYLIIAEDGEKHLASARLLRTDRPHILRDLFPYLRSGPIPEGAEFLEITRFCIEPTLSRAKRRIVRDQLVSALADYAVQKGIQGYSAVAGEAWFSQIAAFGWKCRRLGDVHKVKGERLVALRIDVDGRTTEDLKRGGVYRPCSFVTEQALLEHGR